MYFLFIFQKKKIIKSKNNSNFHSKAPFKDKEMHQKNKIQTCSIGSGAAGVVDGSTFGTGAFEILSKISL